MSNYKTPPAFLRRALDSMLDQTFSDFEIVVVNDGVKDESYELLKEYAATDKRIRLIENARNLGLPASLNRGIEQCRGTYIARMDTDDICYPDRLQLQTDFMASHPEIMFSGAWADQFEMDENTSTGRFEPVMCSREEFRIRLLFVNSPLLVHPTVIFRSDFLHKYKLRYSEDPRYRYSEDYEFWTRCIDYGAAGILERPVIRYRQSDADSRITVQHKDEMSECSRNVQKKLFARLKMESLYDPELNMRLLSGRKPFDLRYKQWMERILVHNKQFKIYDQSLMRKLFHDQWYNIVYYGIAYEKNHLKQIRYFLSLYPDGYVRFVKSLVDRKEKNQ